VWVCNTSYSISTMTDHTDNFLESRFNQLPSSLREICGSVIFPNDQGSALADACCQNRNILFGASDASYKHDQATHAWVISSGNVSDLASSNLSILGSGYVDGYAPHMSSARGELCEHTRILRALIEHPQGNLEEIQQKPCRAPKMNLGGRPYRKAWTYATRRTRAYSTKR